MPMMLIEKVVGALSATTKGVDPVVLVAGIVRYMTSIGDAMPTWLTVDCVTAVQERMRRLLGQWRATRFGDAMELAWPGQPIR